MPKNPELESLLNFDPLYTAETALGGDRSEASGLLGLALAIKHNEAKDAVLDALDDTKFSNKMVDAIRIVEREGFQLLVTIPFVGKQFPNDPETPEEFRIYWNPELSALLCMESYHTDSLNTGKVYFAWKATDQNRPYPSGCSGGGEGPAGDCTFVGDYDIREAFAYRLNRMKETGEFIKQWPKTPFLWLLHWMDTKEEGYNYQVINAERLAMLPTNVIRAMGIGR